MLVKNKRHMGQISHLRNISLQQSVALTIRSSCYHPPCNTGMDPYFNIHKFPSPIIYHLPSLVETGTLVLDKNCFEVVNASWLCRYYIFSPSLERRGPSFEPTLNPPRTRMHCVEFGWNWPGDSGKEYTKGAQCIFTMLQVIVF